LPEFDDSAPEVDGWPFSTEKARAMQKSGEGPAIESLALTDEIRLDLARIPAGTFIMGDRGGCRDELPRVPVTIDEPFRMGTTEVTNELYGLFDPEHDSRFIDQQWKDHTTPGYPANLPKQPVIRVSWNEANEFCRWLSRKTGRTFRLPTEAEWEWACRAGADTPMWFGGLDADFGTKANLADTNITKFVVKGVNPRPVNHEPWQAFIPRTDQSNDGAMIAIDVGSYEPNPWGLMEMHGSVAEWTASDYAPYPYANDGRNAPDTGNRKVVRGGSWRDVPDRARAGFRLKYQPWQKVFNVGFRVVCED
jgi:formylglycine-generating enzyme required for sulfatase activity